MTTNITSLTNEELDRRIAEIKLTEIAKTKFTDERDIEKFVHLFLGIATREFTTDPRYAMELLKEMPKGFRVWQTHKGWICAKINSIWRQADTLERAIAEAYATMKEGE